MISSAERLTVAILTALCRHYTQWLVIAAVFGLIVEFMMAQDGKVLRPVLAALAEYRLWQANGDSEWAYINGAFIVVWASLFLRYWEREENSLQVPPHCQLLLSEWASGQVKWDTQDHEDEEKDRYEFQGTR